MPDHRLRRRERVLHRRDYDRVFARKCRVGGGALLVYVCRNNLGWSRLGLSVGRKAGGAVVRNRIRRRLREAFRLSKETLPDGLDIVCVVSTPPVGRGAVHAHLAIDTLVARAMARLEPRNE